ncbi:hypothetical protein HAZT_HAZT003911 [Hyalella azteca]|uniref:Ornithine aminotransferase n=1 Tax=Hyalella azteca TaxID=294128 RepID=A0A6A0H8M5_HYAAZ|nr:hypothetical protein HAZT_HAZT003911 [Hyalella azteca]
MRLIVHIQIVSVTNNKKLRDGIREQGDDVITTPGAGSETRRAWRADCASDSSARPHSSNKRRSVFMWDVDNKRYYDFLSAYSAVNQGHCHPRIVKALTEQAATLCLTSRAFHNDVLAHYEKFVTELLGYDKLLPMNTGEFIMQCMDLES